MGNERIRTYIVPARSWRRAQLPPAIRFKIGYVVVELSGLVSSFPSSAKKAFAPDGLALRPDAGNPPGASCRPSAPSEGPSTMVAS